MRRFFTLCLALAGLATVCSAQQPEDWTPQVTFYTPSIVRIHKADLGVSKKQSLSVTMQPQQVKDIVVPDNGAYIYKTSALMVRVSGSNITFMDRKGNVLLSELSSSGLCQSFSLDEDEPIYGLGILQEGRMDMRGTERRMIQGNTDDYCNIIQSIKEIGRASCRERVWLRV